MDANNLYSEIQIEDAENYKSTPLGIKEIALKQFDRCCMEGSHSVMRNPKEGGNQQEIFSNAVDMFESILTKELKKPKLKEVKDKLTKLNEELLKLENEYSENKNQLKEQIEDNNHNKSSKAGTGIDYYQTMNEIYAIYQKGVYECNYHN